MSGRMEALKEGCGLCGLLEELLTGVWSVKQRYTIPGFRASLSTINAVVPRRCAMKALVVVSMFEMKLIEPLSEVTQGFQNPYALGERGPIMAAKLNV